MKLILIKKILLVLLLSWHCAFGMESSSNFTKKLNECIQGRKDTRLWVSTFNSSFKKQEIKVNNQNLESVHQSQIQELKTIIDTRKDIQGKNIAIASVIFIYKVNQQLKVKLINMPYVFLSGVVPHDITNNKEYGKRFATMGNFFAKNDSSQIIMNNFFTPHIPIQPEGTGFKI